jgi:hypothetical protein
MSCPQVIDVIARVGPFVVDVVTPGPPGPPGESGTSSGSASRLLRFAVGAWSAGQRYVYLGSAPSGTAESVTGWIVRRFTQNTAGAVVVTASATGAWSNYPSLTYS